MSDSRNGKKSQIIQARVLGDRTIQNTRYAKQFYIHYNNQISSKELDA
ncbi:MAG: hypothetical protein ACMUEM_06715 [Flavobacteriales bacterium AspAUS03]